MVTQTRSEPLRGDSCRLLFSCHSSEEIGNLVPVAEELEARFDSIECEFISQDPFYVQQVEDVLADRGVSLRDDGYPLELDQPYPFCSLREKVQAIVKTPESLRSVVAEYDGFVFGFDGLPVRMMTHTARRMGIPTFQILQGYQPQIPVRDSTFRDAVETRVKQLVKTELLGRVPGLEYLSQPTYIGGSHDGPIFVSGSRTKATVTQRGVESSRVQATGVPRFCSLFERARDDPDVGGECPVDILYVPSAFESHGYGRLAVAQNEQVERLVDATLDSEDVRLTIKPHPRERDETYDWIPDDPRVAVLSPDTDLYETVFDSDMVLTILSTVAYEAAVLGRPVSLLRFPESKCRWLDTAPMNRDFPASMSVTDVLEMAESLKRDREVGRSLVSDARKNAYDVFDEGTPTATETIADAILDGL